MIQLSAFADEISPDLDAQLETLKVEGINALELRSVWNTNVLDLSGAQIATIRRALDAAGIMVAAIGSPIGKIPIDTPLEEHAARFELAIAAAHAFGTRFIRIFSFHPPASDPTADPASYRDEVLRRLASMATRAAAEGIILLHENDTGLYGDTIERCVDVLQQVGSSNLLAAFDPQNSLRAGDRPYPDAYEAFKPWLAYVHVKDMRADGQMVAAGDGIAGWPELLARLQADGYDGGLALEPHLTAAGPLGGFSGPDLFRHATRSLRRLLAESRLEYR